MASLGGSAGKEWAAVHAIDSLKIFGRSLEPLTHDPTVRIEESRHCWQSVSRRRFRAVVDDAADL